MKKNEPLKELAQQRLSKECDKLDISFEQQLANDDCDEDFKAWSKYQKD